MKKTTLRRMVVLASVIAALTGADANAAWWEHPHDKWYLKDDWKAAEVERYAPAFRLQSPAAGGWVVVWGHDGVELKANGAVVMNEVDRGLVYNADLTPFVRGALEVKLQCGPPCRGPDQRCGSDFDGTGNPGSESRKFHHRGRARCKGRDATRVSGTGNQRRSRSGADRATHSAFHRLRRPADAIPTDGPKREGGSGCCVAADGDCALPSDLQRLGGRPQARRTGAGNDFDRPSAAGFAQRINRRGAGRIS